MRAQHTVPYLRSLLQQTYNTHGPKNIDGNTVSPSRLVQMSKAEREANWPGREAAPHFWAEVAAALRPKTARPHAAFREE